jgi:hypothetical protein
MRVAIVVGLLLVFGCAARGKGIDRQVERGSQLETELGYKLSVRDKHDEWRSEGLDGVFPIEGPAPEYVVKFHATAAGKLEDLSGLALTVKRADEIVVQVPLAIRSIWNKENEVDVQFLIKKDMINGAVLSLRCERRSEAGGSYIIRLRDYVQGINLPKKSLPKKSLSEAVATAEEFLRTEKLDVSKGVLLSAEFNGRCLGFAGRLSEAESRTLVAGNSCRRKASWRPQRLLKSFCGRRKSTFPSTYCLKLSSRFTYSTSVRAPFGRSRGFLATSVSLFGSHRTAQRS